MGTFTQHVEVSPIDESRYEAVEAIVDTGSMFCALPASLLRRLGVEPRERDIFELADGRLVERDIGEMRVRVDGRSTPTLCIFAQEGTEPILGAHALEGLSLAVDPAAQRLIRRRPRW